MKILRFFKILKKPKPTVETTFTRLRISKTTYPKGKKQFGHNAEWYGY
jgi:hypothetical protein